MARILLASLLFTAVATGMPSPAAIVAQMTLEEKLAMVHGNSSLAPPDYAGYVGYLPGCPRLKVPPLAMNDGPEGFRAPVDGTSTQFPSGLTVAMAWDRDLMATFGAAMGREFRAKGADILFGPGLNVARLPWGGRNFEYLSGEDPFLGYELAQSVTAAIQAQGVMANAKHFFNNNQENDRHNVSENVDERTQMEIYMPPFEGAARAGLFSVMCANNRINQVYSCENAHAVQQLLRGPRVNFTGFMLSDYMGTRSTLAAAKHGLDIQMPGCTRPDTTDPLQCTSDPARPNYFGEPLGEAVRNGSVAQGDLDAMVTRTLTAMMASGIFSRTRAPSENAKTNVTSEVHRNITRDLAVAAATLLKNEGGLLPLDAATVGTVAVLGAAASAAGATTGGGGSGRVVPAYVSAVLDAVRAVLHVPLAAPPPRTCTANPGVGYQLASHADLVLQQQTASADACSAVCRSLPDCVAYTWEGVSGACRGAATVATETRRNGVTSGSGVISGVCPRAILSPSTPRVVYDDGSNLTRAAVVAAAADVAIVVLASTSSEGSDRTTLRLENDALATAAGKAQARTVVVAVSPGQFLAASWADSVASLLAVGLPGQEEGNAVAEVLFNGPRARALGAPRGRLPFTLPNAENEMNFTTQMYPGVDHQANYTEKLEVGYRWYNAHGVQPLFAFGHGLSYSTFAYASLQVTPQHGKELGFSVTASVTNTGTLFATDVAQAYLTYPAVAGEPPLQLRGFASVPLAAGATSTVTFELRARAFSVWSTDTHDWTIVQGTYALAVGRAVDNLLLHTKITVQ